MKTGTRRNSDALLEARERFAEEWLDFRESIRVEVGTEPRWRQHIVWPVLALTAGVALGAGAFWRSRRSRLPD